MKRATRGKKIDYAKLHTGEDTEAYINEHSYLEFNITVCPNCKIPESMSDNVDGIIWYGCDTCTRWWHRHCLTTQQQTNADLSCLVEAVKFQCPACPTLKLCEVCMAEGESGFCQCQNCIRFYHTDCLPDSIFTEYKRSILTNLPWYCTRCQIET